MIDLHTHSTFSDGADTPEELAEQARRLGLTAIALTDHDTTASHDEMARACAARDIEHITGVEISLRDDAFPRRRGGEEGPRNVHVLAYFVPLDPTSEIQRRLATLREDRVSRNARLVDLLVDLGFTRLTLADLEQRAHHLDSIGRPHFAQAMFDLHPEIVGEPTSENWNRLFQEWLGSEGRAYLPKTDMTIDDFVEAARGSGTVFSIAHPLLNYLDDRGAAAIEATMPSVMASLRERGFAGVEAHYGGSDAATRALMVKLTRDAGMIPTGGSDYHGSVKAGVQLGHGGSGDLRVPDEILDELKAAR